jgi:transposase
MAREDLTDEEWSLIEPHLPLGERGPVRAHHHAAGTVLGGELADAPKEAVEQEKRLSQRSRTPALWPLTARVLQ